MKQPMISIIMGSDSDLPVMGEAIQMLERLEIPYECTIVSAHRTPDRMYHFAKDASKRGVQVIIAGAGGAAHLPGMVASITDLPVIGVPIKSKNLKGLDSLYSIVQMPSGIPVATVGIDGGENAALLAAKIIGLKDKKIQERLKAYKEELGRMVEEKASKLEDIGYKQYMNQ